MDKIEDLVWGVVCQTLLNPAYILDALDQEAASQFNKDIRSQIEYLGKQLQDNQKQLEKLYTLYQREIIDIDEYSARRKVITDSNRAIEESLVVKQGQMLTEENIAARKEQVLQVSQQARELGVSVDTAEEQKRRIIHTVIERIVINTIEGWFEIFGLINGTWSIPSDKGDGDGEDNEATKQVRLLSHKGIHQWLQWLRIRSARDDERDHRPVQSPLFLRASAGLFLRRRGRGLHQVLRGQRGAPAAQLPPLRAG
jgi:hypothetical protein